MTDAPDPPCDGRYHDWRILLPEEVAERFPGEERGVAVVLFSFALWRKAFS